MTDFPPKSPAVAAGTPLGQATTYVDDNNTSSGFQGNFKYLYADHYTEEVSTYSPSNILTRIYNNSVQINTAYSRIDITVPAKNYDLTTLTMISKDISFPGSVYLNGVLRSIIWVGRTYNIGFKQNSTVGTAAGIGTNITNSVSYCGPTPSINQSSCWKIITLRVYHGNITNNTNDVLIFGSMEGETSVTTSLAPYP